MPHLFGNEPKSWFEVDWKYSNSVLRLIIMQNNFYVRKYDFHFTRDYHLYKDFPCREFPVRVSLNKCFLDCANNLVLIGWDQSASTNNLG